MTTTSTKPKLLIVDDEPPILDVIQTILKDEGFDTYTALSFQQADSIVGKTSMDVVLLDLVLPDESGIDLILPIKIRSPHTEIIVLTAYGSIESAVEAIKLGAFAYLTKPIKKSELIITVRNALQTSRLKAENKHLKGSSKK